MLTCDITSIQSLTSLAECIRTLAQPGDIFLLEGDLGAGKTTFVKVLASLCGIDPREVTSPTFGLVHRYLSGSPGMGSPDPEDMAQRFVLVHADLYRLGPGADIYDTGIQELMDEADLVAVEWAEYLQDGVVTHGLRLRFHLDFTGETDETGIRQVEIIPVGDRWTRQMRALQECIEKSHGLKNNP